MTPLRQRMLDDALQLRGMAPRTQEAYIAAVARLARHYRRSPDALSADEVQQYLPCHCVSRALDWNAVPLDIGVPNLSARDSV